MGNSWKDEQNGPGWFSELVAAYPAHRGAPAASLSWFCRTLADADAETRQRVLVWAARYAEEVRASRVRLADVQYLGAAIKARAWESGPGAADWPGGDNDGSLEILIGGPGSPWADARPGGWWAPR